MTFYYVQKLHYDNIVFYQAIPFDFFETLKHERTLKDKINFIKNGSFSKDKANGIANKKSLEEFNKKKGY